MNKNMWGKICSCGTEVYDFFDDHPWGEDNVKKVKCSNCNKINDITNKEAIRFYESKVYELYEDVNGTVLDIGCGGGLITRFLANKKDVNYVVAVDKEVANEDEDKDEVIKNLHANEFFDLDLNNFDETIFNRKFDYIVCRDVLMYLDDIEYTFSKLSKISNKVILVNWYNVNHKNCLNKTSPEDICKIIRKYYSSVKLTYPSFYKWGYMIKSK